MLKKPNFQKAQYKILIENFSYMGLLQVFNILFPLLSYAFLIRILGAEMFGLIVFAQSLVAYLIIIIDFGFNISATRQVSIYRDDPKILAEIVSAVFLIKTFLAGMSIMIFFLFLSFIPQADDHKILFILSLWSCIHSVFFAQWYFQGIEQMKYIAILTLVSRSVFFILVFFIVTGPEDYLLVPLLYGLGALISGIASLFLIFKQDNVKFQFPSSKKLIFYFNDALPMFLSSAAGSLHTNAGKIILGLSVGMTSVTYFDLAEKMLNLLRTPLNVVSQVIYPRNARDRDISFIRRAFSIIFVFNVILLTIFILGLNNFIFYLAGPSMLGAIPVAKILSVMLLLSTVGGILGIQVLCAFGYAKDFSVATIVCALTYVILILFLYSFDLITPSSIALATVFSEIIIIVLIIISLRKYNLLNPLFSFRNG